MRIIIKTVLLFFLILASAVQAAEGLKAGDVDPATGKVIEYWVAPMDPAYIRKTPGKSPMGMDLVPVYRQEGGEKLPTSSIRIDPVTVQNMGVRYGFVRSAPLAKTIRALGRVSYDESRVYDVNTKFEGWIDQVYVDFIGKKVSKGEALFTIYSPLVVAAQQEYLLAVAQARYFKKQRGEGLKLARQNAESLLRASQQRLDYLDIGKDQRKKIAARGRPLKNITFYSPVTGVVVQKNVRQGSFVKPGMSQYQVADLSTVWLDVDVYESDLSYVQEGMKAEMELVAFPGQRFQGEVLFIYPYLDAKTRTAGLRLSFKNPENKFKPAMYANVYLQAKIADKALLIPQEAVIDSGLRQIVFVAKEGGVFEPRTVKLGVTGENHLVQVLTGLEAGEKIVTSSQFLLDSESRLQEAIQKMLEPEEQPAPAADFDMSDEGMDDSFDMSDMTMEDQAKGQ
ncbi:efflux RND transporter periplasmic adaptor subunit [Desulfotalea psychrophila]|nr:efflux RND transporter periplasmic adaptor subunit [Desulfotalea psychrophila]